MRQQTAKNILMKDGTARRISQDQCEQKLSTGEAKRYISNTVFRAMKLGIEVKDHSTRDENGALKKRIQEASLKQKTAAHKASEKQKGAMKAHLRDIETQEILNTE